MRVALDIETECRHGCETACDHALDERHNRITVIGIYSPSISHAFRADDVQDACGVFSDWVLGNCEPLELVGQNLKWDLRQLGYHGTFLGVGTEWADDTLLMAAALSDKIPDSWLADYEAKRKVLNAALPRGYSHRMGTPNTLKCLAPYHLGVEPFWENPVSHDSDEYVLRDCEYTYRLADILADKLRAEGSYDFYKDKLLPWTKLLLRMERKGVALDLAAMDEAEQAAKSAADEARAKLDAAWAPAYAAWAERRRVEECQRYVGMFEAAVAKLKLDAKFDDRRAKCVDRYRGLQAAALTKLDTSFNLNSPTQLEWLLRDHLGHDIHNFEGEESTGKVVLKRLAVSDPNVATLLGHRQQSKLVSAFFPTWRALHHDGAMHTTFHPTRVQQEGADDENGTRTGRLSSSGPNLQQVPGHLHRLFRARPGCKLITRDASAIEPRLIAYYTQDENLFNIVATGDDFHGHTTRVLFEYNCPIADIKRHYTHQRNMGKRIGLQLFYGSGAGGLQRTAQEFGFMWSKRECYKKLDAFREYYAGVFRYRDEVINPALMEGQAMTNLMGRRFRIAHPSDVHMTGFNTLIQGSASDLVWNSAHMAQETYDLKQLGAHVLLLVHDEIVVEAPACIAQICDTILDECMTGYELFMPLGPVKLATEGKISDVWEK